MLRRALLIAGLLFVATAGAAAAMGPPRDDKPVQAICSHAGGAYNGPNWIWRLDTTGLTDAGYGCVFPAFGAGGPSPSAILDAPSLARSQALCSAAGGHFYTFVVDPPLWAYFGWGCSFF
jgi:hypothetical protein